MLISLKTLICLKMTGYLKIELNIEFIASILFGRKY